MKKLYFSLIAILFTVILTSCNKPDTETNPIANEGKSFDNILASGPSITNISPTSAEIGDLITITGSNFGTAPGTRYYVTINGKAVSVYQSWNNTQIKVIVPSGSTLGSGKVFVTANNKNSNQVNFTRLQSTPVTIGDQVWMGYNLDVDHYRNGDSIPEVKDSATWVNLTTGAWCYYNNNSANGPIYGKLYNWYAVNDSRGLAPSGWHVSTDGEWKTLSMYLGMTQAEADKYGYDYYGTTEGGKLKEMGTSLWYSPNTGATNTSGFTALPGGMRSTVAGYNFACGFTGANWWTSTNYNDRDAWARALDRSSAKFYRNYLYKKQGFSVRCVKD